MPEYIDPNQLKQLEQIEAMKRQILSRMLSKEAYERLARVKIVNPELAAQVELYLLQIYQSGRLDKTISDSQLKGILGLLSQKKDFKIMKK
ncbi:MAG: DNA-binding protein [Candidatus Aenigmarchaeota archaeon]|nr:DNA-binding protein [Candidatus Aenigmarchaeota archaeon]